jgi:nicotinate-nucleotide adenylyltransferase
VSTAVAPEASGEIAVFGGSFDPPHVAHVLVVSWVLAVTDVERVLVVPSFVHPFAKPLAPFGHRARMAELAMRDLSRVEVSRVEQELGGDGRTLFTLQELSRRMPTKRLRLVVGADLLVESSKWYAFDRVCALAPLLVVGRTGYATQGAAAAIELPNVSSTEVRRRLRAGEPVDGLVPSVVARYANEHALYRGVGP